MTYALSYLFCTQASFAIKVVGSLLAILRIVLIWVFSWVVRYGYSEELREQLRILGVSESVTQVDRMVENIEGENQLKLMTQLVALT